MDGLGSRTREGLSVLSADVQDFFWGGESNEEKRKERPRPQLRETHRSETKAEGTKRIPQDSLDQLGPAWTS
jgi:hypothetical protein